MGIFCFNHFPAVTNWAYTAPEVGQPLMNRRILLPSPPIAVTKPRAGLERGHPLAKYRFRVDRMRLRRVTAIMP
jgi:hypothetical protein